MGRNSIKENKTIYQQRREELGLSRDKASELLEWISPEQIERIESGKKTASPDEVVLMAEKYQDPSLRNYYCANECAIGTKYVPEVRVKHLSQIVLEMISTMNTVEKKQERLIEITADGKIENDEVDDFIQIQQDLEKISLTVEALKLWAERKIAVGDIDLDAYEEAKEKYGIE